MGASFGRPASEGSQDGGRHLGGSRRPPRSAPGSFRSMRRRGWTRRGRRWMLGVHRIRASLR